MIDLRFRWRAGCLAASGLALAAPSARAASQTIEAEHRFAFVAPGIDPWRGGRAIAEERDYSIGPPRFDFTLPRTGINPLPALARALDLPFDPPEIGFAEMGGNIRGEAALRFGYRFTTGELNIVYPGSARLRVSSRAPNGRFAAGQEVVVDTTFTPGLPVPVRADRALCPAVTDRAACLIGAHALSLLATLGEPRFNSRFPDARAYARFDYDLAAGFTVSAGIARGAGLCFQCYSRTFSISDARTVPLVEVSPHAATIAGIGEVRLADREVPVPGVGRIVFNYPDLRVAGMRRGVLDLEGEDTREILRFEGAVERLVPVLGGFLRNSLGPVGYSLLETNAGPSLSLRQSFHIAVTPRVTLHFSRPVEIPGRRGLQESVTASMGRPIRFRPTMDSTGLIQITPTYHLDMTVTNRTGLTLGYRIDFGGLRLTMGPAEAGPLRLGVAQDGDVIRSPAFCCDPFRVEAPPITAHPISIEIGDSIEGAVGTDARILVEGGRNAVPGSERRRRGQRQPGAGQIGTGLGQGPRGLPRPVPSPHGSRPGPVTILHDQRPGSDQPRPNLQERPLGLPRPRPDERTWNPDPAPVHPRPRPHPGETRPDIGAQFVGLPAPSPSMTLSDELGGRVYVASLPERMDPAVADTCPDGEGDCRLRAADMTAQVLRHEVSTGPTIDISNTGVDPRSGPSVPR